MYVVDSGVWIGAFNPRDRYYEKAKPIVQAVSSGALGKILITDHIFGEVTTYLRRKVGPDRSAGVGEAMLNSPHLETVFVDEDVFNAAHHIFRRYTQLSFADAVSVVIVRGRKSPGIFSFDSGFDAVRDVRRLDALP